MRISITNIILLAAVLVLGVMSLTDCSGDKGLIKDLKKELDEKVEVYKGQIESRDKKIDSIRSVLSDIDTDLDTIYVEIEKDRKRSSELIDEAKNRTVEEADSILKSKYETSVGIITDLALFDSLKLEFKSLVAVQEKTEEKLFNQKIINNELKLNIVDKDEIITAREQKIEILNTELKDQKRKKYGFLLKGFVIGVPVGVVTYLVLKDS